MTESVEAWILPLNDKYYQPDSDEEQFLKEEIGILDSEELKKHIIAVQTKAFAIYPYPCIRIFEFTRLRLGRHPAYKQLLKLGEERKDGILIDLGTCFGNDIRKAVQDGYPVKNTLATDLRKGLWDLGHEMFRSSPETFQTNFIEGDVFNTQFLECLPLFTLKSPPSTSPPSLDTVKTLNALHGHVSAFYTGAFFHLFDEQQQAHISRALAGLLSPIPGSMILGVHGGSSSKGYWCPTASTYKMFCHSPESWKELWRDIFEGENVEVQAELRQGAGGADFFDTFPGNHNPYHFMEWSVRRL
ncbi:hypothetical protein D9757_008564 [Collybiopsis confluens]|uniref:Methyltransferase domain-containing protein n=1 Tax=Collybiopsis confluens TaxID=2823264 RepID=A0A8H5H2S7_9AGAR|nr:hypothetical protein D9757_008564 [Collybiopsis confluens]